MKVGFHSSLTRLARWRARVRAGGRRKVEAGAEALPLVPCNQPRHLLPAPGQLGGFDASRVLTLIA